jgi:hypothetical protein
LEIGFAGKQPGCFPGRFLVSGMNNMPFRGRKIADA